MLRVLTYHRIAGPERDPQLSPRLVSATPEVFARQVQHLASHYHVLGLVDVLEAVEARRGLPRRAVLITFDDAYRDFLEVAWPILQRHRLPATLFVPTAYPDRPERGFWWDRLHRAFTDPARSELVLREIGKLPLQTRAERLAAMQQAIQRCKQLRHDEAMLLVEAICDQLGEDNVHHPSVLGWEELRALASAGVAVCAHTRWHPLLTRLSRQRAREEIAGSQADVEQEIGDGLPAFCYPDGAHDDVVVELVRQEGFVLAFTQIDGHSRLGVTDPLRIFRTNITPRTTLPAFRLRLHTWFTHVDRWRHERRQASRSAYA